MGTIQQISKRKLYFFSTTVLVIFILFIESTCSIFYRYKWEHFHTNLSVQGNIRLVSDSFLLWNNRPFYLDFYERYQYNELGMRSRPGEVFMPEKTDKDFWVFLLGGSLSAGMGSNINGKWLDISNISDHPIDSSIDGFLEKILQKQIPDKKVKVFNAAITGASIHQSIKNYKRLKKYKPDWVVSIDGVNEPKIITDTLSIWKLLQEKWIEDGEQNYTKNAIYYFTSHSALLNLLKKYFFFFRYNIRKSYNEKNNFPEKHKWLNKAPTTLPIVTTSDVKMATDSFLIALNNFSDILHADKQKHLLFVQPHISLRDTGAMSNTTEKAIYNYYTYQDYAPTNSYYKLLNKKINAIDSSSIYIYSLGYLHQSSNWVFIDYCHVTSKTNKLIAEKIASLIIAKK